MAKGKRKSYFFLVLTISLLIICILRMLLTHIIGSKGVSYFSVSLETFLLIAGTISFGLEKSVSVLVENYIDRQQYENAKRVVRGGLLIALILCLVTCLLMLFFGKSICSHLFNVPLSYMSYIVSVPAVVLFIVSGVLRGYFKGTGNKRINSFSYLIFVAVFALSGALLSMALFKYGVKVSMLLRVEDYKYSYGSLGAAFGLLVASFTVFIYNLIIYIIINRRTVFENSRDYSKSIESVFYMAFSVLLNALFGAGIWFSVFLTPVLNEIIVFSDKESENALEFVFGEYYGKTQPVIFILAALICFTTYSFIRKTIHASLRDENRVAREKLGRLIHRCLTVGFMTAGFVIAFADNILNLFFEEIGASTVSFLQTEAASLVFVVLSAVFIEIMLGLKFDNAASIICIISMVVHTLYLLLIVKPFKLSVTGIIIGNIIFFLIICALSYFVMSRFFQYTQEWFRNVGVSLIGALVVSIIMLLLNKALSPVLGKTITMLVLGFVGILIYMVILLALRGYSEDELEESIMGRFMLSVGRLFRII